MNNKNLMKKNVFSLNIKFFNIYLQIYKTYLYTIIKYKTYLYI